MILKKPLKATPIIAVDTREQLPYEFPGWPCIRKTLQTGDYSVLGHESRFAIERKSQADLLGCWHTDRFKAELARLSRFEKAFLVIESSIWKLKNDRFYRGNINGVLGFLQSVPLLYGVQVLLLDSRAEAQTFVQGLLEKYTRYQMNEIKGVKRSERPD